jgi:aminomethyltransferase
MLKRTPFYETHKKAGARLIDFGGFEMPVQYEGIKVEHAAVRENAGIFDVSHMGEVFVSGAGASRFLQNITINDVSKLVPGKAQYSAMCYPNAGIVDDLIVYMMGDNNYMVVVNASNREKDVAWMMQHKTDDVVIDDRSEYYALLALQGPKSAQILSKITNVDLTSIAYYHFTVGTVAGFADVIVSATGYTGEPGFEIYFDVRTADPVAVWNAIIEAGADLGLKPCGLGARDTLRLEMGYALYGNDISDTTTPLEAGLAWITKLDKGNFIGREALLLQKEAGITRKLTGFMMEDEKAIPRSHYIVRNTDGEHIGEVTSGTQSVTLSKGVGMAYVDLTWSKPGQPIVIDIRGKLMPATTQKPPFVKKT